LGYAYYKQNDFENAISQFNKIINGKDFVAQNAYYHLGESYLKLDKKQEALNAFKMLLKWCRLTSIQEDESKLCKIKLWNWEFVPKCTCGFVGLSKNIQITLVVCSGEIIDWFVYLFKNYKEALILLEK
jgi:tetratricopeptide (TPR) repeat protein